MGCSFLAILGAAYAIHRHRQQPRHQARQHATHGGTRIPAVGSVLHLALLGEHAVQQFTESLRRDAKHGHGGRAQGQFFFHIRNTCCSNWQKKTATKPVATTSDSTPPKRWNIVRDGSRYAVWDNAQCYVFRIWLSTCRCRQDDTGGHKKSPRVRKWTITVVRSGLN